MLRVPSLTNIIRIFDKKASFFVAFSHNTNFFSGTSGYSGGTGLDSLTMVIFETPDIFLTFLL